MIRVFILVTDTFSTTAPTQPLRLQQWEPVCTSDCQASSRPRLGERVSYSPLIQWLNCCLTRAASNVRS